MEFSSKPILTPYELVLLRRILNMSLEEICDLLHIGKNTYGRWERGEVAITPSMNLLVHNFMDRFREVKVNLIEMEMQAAIKEAKKRYFNDSLSLGEFIRKVLSATKILPEVICRKIGSKIELFNQIQNNEVSPEKIPVEISAKILVFFQLTIKNLRQLLDNTLAIHSLGKKVSFVYTRKANYGQKGVAAQSKSINKILEQYLEQERSSCSGHTISEDYIKKIEDYIMKKMKMEEK
jgi:transcriptional regulator with XRE-family HTH domain